MTIKKPGRPPSVRTRQFQRYISDSQAAVIAAAGAGNMSEGFYNLIDLYRQLYELGMIRGDNIDCCISNLIKLLGTDTIK
jgi:hypothetical protein